MIDQETIQALEAQGFKKESHCLRAEGIFYQKDLPGGTVAINKEGQVLIGPEIGFEDYHFETKVESIKEFEQLVKILDSGKKSIIERIALNPLFQKHLKSYANKEDVAGYMVGPHWIPNIKQFDFSGFNTNKKTMDTETIEIEGLGIRAEVVAFAKQMELILRKNDFKGGWKKTPISGLIERLENELSELSEGYPEEGPIALMNECVDIANYAMMISDKLGRGKK